MNKDYIPDSVNTAVIINAIKTKQYIVGSFGATGLSFASAPKMHAYKEAARNECKRLAQLHPGKLFLFVELTGGEIVPVSSMSF